MKVPGVSEKNWRRAQALSQISVGTWTLDTSDLGFGEQLKAILESAEAGSAEELLLERIEDMEGAVDGQYYHGDWGEEGVTVEYTVGDRQRPHRPQLEEEVVERLNGFVEREYSTVPVESVGFDKKLGLFLDRVERWYELLGCEIREI